MRPSTRPLLRAIRTATLVAAWLTCFAVAELSAPADAPAPHGATPSPQQLRWHQHEFYAFVHFNMNTFTGVEWGHGRESPDRFNPESLDCRQWCALFKQCGLSGVIITAKHHDGFCLWPSKFTEHDVAGSSWRGGRGDVIKDLAEACQEYGLWLGIYISPWDRNNPIYGTDDEAYNDYFVGQLEELLTGYGPIAEVWWDGANGDRDNPEKHQEYDWPRYIRTVRRLQPEAVIFAPPYTPGDIRWVGNERGYAGPTQWATHAAGVAEDPATLNVGIEGADTWMPAETDVSIRPGWYWTRETDDRVKSVDELLDIYHESVGHNTNLLLNFAVDDRGLVPATGAARLRQLAKILHATFDQDLAFGRPAVATNVRGDANRFKADALTDGDPTTYWATDDDVTAASVEIDLEKPAEFNRVVAQEHIELGQRVRAWKIEARIDGRWQDVFQGTTIGHKRIARFPTVKADAVRLHIRDSRACPVIESMGVFATPPNVEFRPAAQVFLNETTVELLSDFSECDIYYTLDGTAPTFDSRRYREPIAVRQSCTIRAVAARAGELSPQIRELRLTGYDEASLRQSVEPAGRMSPGVRVMKYTGGWQTLDQMNERQPVEVSRGRDFDTSQRLRDQHAALAFEALINVPTDGIYEFFLASDDGSRLYLGDALIVDNDGLHGMVEKRGHVGLKAGLHPIRVEWFNALGDMGLEVKWSRPGFKQQPIDTASLIWPEN